MAAKKKKTGTKKGGNQQQPVEQQRMPAEQATSDEVQQQQQQHKNLTHTNLDSTCHNMASKGGWLARLEYQRSLLMALNPKETDELIVLCFVVIFWTCLILYMYAFVSGFRDGFTTDPMSTAESILK